MDGTLFKSFSRKQVKIFNFYNDLYFSYETFFCVITKGQTESNIKKASGSSSSSTSAPAVVSCRHCTFTNKAGKESCEMCGLPLSG